MAKNAISILALVVALVSLSAQFFGSMSGGFVTEYLSPQFKGLLAGDQAPAPLADTNATSTSVGYTTNSAEQVKPYVRIFSYDPFIAHIVDLIRPSEREYLKALAKPLLARSLIRVNGEGVESENRTSSTAFLPQNDTVVQVIMRRVQDFQGYMDYHHLDLQVTSYQEGQQFKAHFDWQRAGQKTNRFSTFFAILDSSCYDCGTNFPKIHVDWTRRDNAWCKFMDCTKDTLTTRNVPGGALYWRNLDENFYGRPDTLHIGLPVVGGYKIGLNIWTEIKMPEGHGRPKVVAPSELPKEEQLKNPLDLDTEVPPTMDTCNAK